MRLQDILPVHLEEVVTMVLCYHGFYCRHRKVLVESLGLLAVIREKLLSAGQPVSIAMFNTLFEVSRHVCDLEEGRK